MDIFVFFSFLGGLALFLYGMKVMGAGLESLSGGRLKALVAKLCSTTWRGVLVGAAATAAIQSSSATTVMVIGFVNSGIMELRHAVGVIMGANLGTTVTSWILSLTGIEGDNFFLRLLKPSSLAPLLAIVGVMLLMSKRRAGRSRLGGILSGLGILFFGMEIMSAAVEPLADMPEFVGILTLFSNPIAGLAAGIILTAIVQSSSASVGILQALSLSGGVSFAAAIPIVMGQNIGTCVTTLISGIGASKNAKRAAFVHLYFNLIGAIVLLIAFYGADAFLNFGFFDLPVTPFWVAMIHTIFNVVATAILLPFSGALQRLAEWTVGRREGTRERTGEYSLLDDRFLLSPATALLMCRMAYHRMCELTKNNFDIASRQFEKYEEAAQKALDGNESLIDSYEDNLGAYLIKLSSKQLTDEENAELSEYMFSIGDTERIADHADNISRSAHEISEGKLPVSDEARYEIRKLFSALDEVLTMTFNSQTSGKAEDAARVEPLCEVIDRLCSLLREHHIERLRSGVCDPVSAPAYDSVLIDAERIAGHCSNLALGVVQRNAERLGAHDFARRLRADNEIEFAKNVAMYTERFGL